MNLRRYTTPECAFDFMSWNWKLISIDYDVVNVLIFSSLSLCSSVLSCWTATRSCTRTFLWSYRSAGSRKWQRRCTRRSTRTRTRTRLARGRRTSSWATRRVSDIRWERDEDGKLKNKKTFGRFSNRVCVRCADYALGKDCIMHGYMLKLGNPFLTQWQRRYFYLFPNRVEWRGEGESRVSSPRSTRI